MRDPVQKKRRDYRKASRSSKGRTSLGKIVNRLIDKQHIERGDGDPLYLYWMQVDSMEQELIKMMVGKDFHVDNKENCPAGFRRDLNRQFREKSKQVMIRAEKSGDWDGALFPRFRKNANWLFF